MIIQEGTNTPVLFDEDCRPSRTRRRKKNCAGEGEKKSTMNLTFHIECIRRKKEMNSIIIVTYFANYHKTHAFIQYTNLHYALHEMTSSSV